MSTALAALTNDPGTTRFRRSPRTSLTRVLSAALAATLLIAGAVTTVTQSAAEGAGALDDCETVFTPEKPTLSGGAYIIDSAAKLVWLSVKQDDDVVDGEALEWREVDYLQTVDIDLGGCRWTPIGTDEARMFSPFGYFGGRDFTGDYDGGGKTITGLFVDLSGGSNEDFAGMFGSVVGNITGVHLEGVSVNGEDYVGALVGRLTGNVTDSSASGAVTGGEYVGGLVGSAQGFLISDASATTTVTGRRDEVGGLVGYALEGHIRHSFATGAVSAVARDEAGGLVGVAEKIEIEASYATGNVTGEDEVGGLVGYAIDGHIRTSFATGNVTGEDYVGGLVGYNSGASISNSYARGAVTGDDYVGGFVGDNGGSISRSYSTGAVTSVGESGGLVSRGSGSAPTESFWDTVTSGRAASAGGTGRNTGQMTSSVTFNDATWAIVQGWEAFAPTATPARVWGICEGVNDGYPFLLWQYESDPCGDGDALTPATLAGQAAVLTPGTGDSADTAITYALSFDCQDMIDGADVFVLVPNAVVGKFYRITITYTNCVGPGGGISKTSYRDGAQEERTATEAASVQTGSVNGTISLAFPYPGGGVGFGVFKCEAPGSVLLGGGDVACDGRPDFTTSADWVIGSAGQNDDDDDDNDNAGSGGGGSSASSTPVLTGGSAPSLPAGQGVWQQSGGTSTPLALASPRARQLRYTAPGLTVTLTGGPGTSATNGLVASPNGTIDCEVCTTLANGEVIEAWMFSTPRLVAAHRIEDQPCQTFTIPVVAPLDGGGPVSAGAHTLQLALPTASGMQAINVGVTVGGLVPSRVPAGEGPTVPLGAALLALLAAAGAVLAARRRVVTG